MIDSVDEYAK